MKQELVTVSIENIRMRFQSLNSHKNQHKENDLLTSYLLLSLFWKTQMSENILELFYSKILQFFLEQKYKSWMHSKWWCQ